jgi:hypothetical protein
MHTLTVSNGKSPHRPAYPSFGSPPETFATTLWTPITGSLRCRSTSSTRTADLG